MPERYALLTIYEAWPGVFGEELRGIGFELFDANVPMLQRCLDARDRTELDEFLASLPAEEF